MTTNRLVPRRRPVIVAVVAALTTASLGLAGPAAGRPDHPVPPDHAAQPVHPADLAADPVPSQAPPGYELAWADEFDGVTQQGTGLDESEWFYREGDKAICTNQPENVSVDDGLLHIRFQELDQPYGDIITSCGGVVSKRWFGYGYYEVRAKLWGERGFHSAFWTTGLSAYIPDVPDYTGPHNRINEIDGFEVDSHAPEKLAYHSHWFMPGHVGNQGNLVTQENSSTAYHTYGFEWTPTEVRFYTDGDLTYTLDKAGPHGIQNVWLTTLGYTDGVVTDHLPGETTWDHFRYFAPVESGHDRSAASAMVDNGDAGYAETGTWGYEVTNGRQVAFGAQDKVVRASGATAAWTPTLPSAGSYEVYAWNPNLLDTGHTAARYTVQHDGGSTDVVLDQTTAGQQWVSLGAYSMTPGAGQRVSVVGDAAGEGILRADAVKFVPSTVVDHGSPGYSEAGTWSTSTAVTGWRGSTTRYASHSAATARWAPTLPAAGRYDVYAWLPPHDTSMPNVSGFEVTHAGGTADVAVTDTTPRDGWVRLGNYAFDAGSGGAVQYGQSADSEGRYGQMRVDAVKFVPAPQEAGAPTTPGGLAVGVSTTPANGDAWFTATWSPVAGADVVGYHVYLDGQRLTWQPVRRNLFRLHELLAGQSYDITVTAVDRLGNESAPSAAVPAVAPADTRAPTPPSGLVAEAANGQAVLYWAQNTELDLGGYNVYVDGELVNGSVPVGNINDETNRPLGYPVKASNDVTHTIEVRTLDLVGNESASATTTVTPLAMSIIGVEDTAHYSETGTWTASSVAGWLATPTRTSPAAAASAQWRPQLDQAGEYEVWAWVPNNANSTAAARYTVTSADGASTTDIDQRSGGARWISLGTHTFAAGTGGFVTVTNQAGSGYLRTNAVKFVPLG